MVLKYNDETSWTLSSEYLQSGKRPLFDIYPLIKT